MSDFFSTFLCFFMVIFATRNLKTKEKKRKQKKTKTKTKTKNDRLTDPTWKVRLLIKRFFFFFFCGLKKRLQKKKKNADLMLYLSLLIGGYIKQKILV